MRKIWNICVPLMLAGFLIGCGNRFEPTESTIFITSEGRVRSAIMESFDKDYYNFEELSRAVQQEVEAYCTDAGAEVITVESLTEDNDVVTLLMDYETVEDYIAMNDVLLFHGTYAEALKAGYKPEELRNAEGVTAELTEEEAEKLYVVVTEESIGIQTSGKIKYVSDNVSIIDKRNAKALEAGETHPAFVVYK